MCNIVCWCTGKLSKALKEPPLDQVYASLREFDDEKTVKDIQTDVGVHRPVSLGIRRKMFTSFAFCQIESYSDPYSLHMFMEGSKHETLCAEPFDQR